MRLRMWQTSVHLALMVGTLCPTGVARLSALCTLDPLRTDDAWVGRCRAPRPQEFCEVEVMRLRSHMMVIIKDFMTRNAREQVGVHDVSSGAMTRA